LKKLILILLLFTNVVWGVAWGAQDIIPEPAKDEQVSVPTINDEIRKVYSDVNALDTRIATLESAVHFYDRGDPNADDYGVGDFTTDNTWNDLDLSSIVPVGAKAVLFRLILKDNATGSSMWFRENGNANTRNAAGMNTQVADVEIRGEIIVACDTDRVIEYKGSNLTFTQLDLTVRGWWK